MIVQAKYQLLILVTALAVAAFLLSLGGRSSAQNGARLRVALVVLAAAWSGVYLLEIYSSTLEWKLFWASAKFPFIGLMAVAWLIFALRACGFRAIASPLWASVLLIVPMAVQPIIWTNKYHGWFWERAALVRDDWWVWLDTQNGPVFWIFYLYGLGLALFGIVCMLLVVASNNALSHPRRGILALALVLPILANTVFIMRLGLIPNLSLTPFTGLLSCIAIAAAFSSDLFDKALVDLRCCTVTISTGWL